MTTERITMYTGGTKQASKFISSKLQNGEMIQLYTDDWNRQRYANSPVDNERLTNFQKTYKDLFSGHMLVLCLADATKETLEEFKSLYKPLQKLIEAPSQFGGANLHNPDLAFINLARKQILLVGLGRKNRFFSIDAATSDSVSIDNIDSASNIFSESNEEYFDQFTNLDLFDVVYELVSALAKYGRLRHEHDCYPYVSTDIEIELGDADPSTEILTVNGEEFDRETLETDLKDLQNLETEMLASIATLEKYFPNVDFDGLNTGDY
jgi:hypothetical protein